MLSAAPVAAIKSSNQLTPVSRFWIAVAIVTLGHAVRIERGEFAGSAIALVGVALVALIASCQRWSVPIPERATEVLLGVSLAYELVWATYNPPAVVLRLQASEFRPYIIGAQLLCLSAAVTWFVARRWFFPVLLVGHTVIAIWTIRHSSIVIDVLGFQRDSAAALLRGQDPFAITFRDPYPGTYSAQVYGAGVSTEGRLLFGYPYLPLSLLLVVPAYLLGEVRIAHVAAVLTAAILIHWCARDTTGKLAAAVLLFTPWVFHLEESAWVEVFGVLLFAWATFWPGALNLGLFLAFKQYAVLAVPALWRNRLMGWALVVAAGITAPFALWDMSAFLHSAVSLQFRQPWRTDALSFTVLLNNLGMPRLPWLGFFTAGIAGVYVAWRRDTAPAAIARNVALIYLAFFALSKQAFYNYYFLVLGILCCAMAASGWERRAALIPMPSTNETRQERS